MKAKIFSEKSVPNNIEHISKMDAFMKEILKERTNSNESQLEATIEKKSEQNKRHLWLIS